MSEPTPTEPTYSPDGQWWWNGTQWLPAPPKTPGPAHAWPTEVQTGPKAKGWRPSPGFVVVILIIVGLLAFAAIKENMRASEFTAEQEEMACEEYGVC